MIKKIAIFVDVQNIYYTVRDTYHCHFNYSTFWREIRSEGKIVKAFAYAIDRGNVKQQNFQQILKNIGFEVKLKPFIRRADGSAKGDWDVGITLDVMEYAQDVDRIILLSGDGDFDLLVKKVRRDFNTEVIVYGVYALTAASLINAANHYVSIENHLLL